MKYPTKPVADFLAGLPEASARYWRARTARIAAEGWREVRITRPNRRYRVRRPGSVPANERAEYTYVISPASGGRWGLSRNDYTEGGTSS